MIAFLKGRVEEIEEGRAVLDVNGVGYAVLISGRDAQQLSGRKAMVKLHTYLQVREDAMVLFGFLEREDLQMFQMLLAVNGVGPKAALGILSAMTANELRFAILAGDAKTISRAPGIGNKTAQKMILELKDKVDLADTFESASAQTQEAIGPDTSVAANDAVQALIALGYPGSEALKAVRSVAVTDEMDTEDILRAALKRMTF